MMTEKVTRDGKAYAKITGLCPVCKKEWTLEIPLDEFNEGMRLREEGRLIQFAFPKLSDAERELLISGVCNKCWKDLFGGNEE